jgi:hypothetical protein
MDGCNATLNGRQRPGASNPELTLKGIFRKVQPSIHQKLLLACPSTLAEPSHMQIPHIVNNQGKPNRLNMLSMALAAQDAANQADALLDSLQTVLTLFGSLCYS